MRATHPFAEPTTRIGQVLQRAWAPGQRRLDLLVHARRIAERSDAHHTLNPEIYGRPDAYVTERVVRAIEEAHPGLGLVAIGFWGNSRDDVQKESLAIRVGFLMKNEGGVPAIATAEMVMPKNTVAASGWERFANWALEQRITLVRDLATDTWAWNSERKFDRDPVPTLASAIYGTDREIELESGLLDRAAQLVHDTAQEQRARLGTHATPEAVPVRRRPGL